jgi:membrane associated rhomboid family serine protease
MSTAMRAMGLPWLTLTLLGAALALLFAPDLAAQLRFERAPLLAGEWWRALSGHLVHGHPALAAADLCVLAALGTWWESRSRKAYVAILLGSACLSSLALIFLSPFESYVGASALGCGLLVGLLVEWLRAAHGGRRALPTAALLAFATKCAFESLGDCGPGLVSLPPGTRVAACAHAAGGLAGAAVALLPGFRVTRRVTPRSAA